MTRYVAMGLTAFSVIAASILLFFLFYEIRVIRDIIVQLIDILMPFLIGAVIAYLLAPLYNLLCRNLDHLFSLRLDAKRSVRLARVCSVLLSILAALALIGGVVALVVPQLVSSIMRVVNAMPGYVEQINQWINGLAEDYPFYGEMIQDAFANLSTLLQNWVTTDLLPNLENFSELMRGSVNTVLGNVVQGVVVAVQAVKNLVLGFIIAAYLLAGKNMHMAVAKKLLYAVLGASRGNEAMLRLRYIHQIFGGFIRGQIIDALFVGIICFLGTSLLRIPYAALISVVVGVTNVIPFFGPFLGAIPSGILILLTDPIKCIYFAIFILALQQFDGNIMVPRILGNATGISAFGVLFAIIFFGGLFGFVGMIIGVPLYAVISSIVSEIINGKLRKKELSLDTNDYVHLDYVDPEKHEYVKMRDPTNKDSRP